MAKSPAESTNYFIDFHRRWKSTLPNLRDNTDKLIEDKNNHYKMILASLASLKKGIKKLNYQLQPYEADYQILHAGLTYFMDKLPEAEPLLRRHINSFDASDLTRALTLHAHFRTVLSHEFMNAWYIRANIVDALASDKKEHIPQCIYAMAIFGVLDPARFEEFQSISRALFQKFRDKHDPQKIDMHLQKRLFYADLLFDLDEAFDRFTLPFAKNEHRSDSNHMEKIRGICASSDLDTIEFSLHTSYMFYTVHLGYIFDNRTVGLQSDNQPIRYLLKDIFDPKTKKYHPPVHSAEDILRYALLRRLQKENKIDYPEENKIHYPILILPTTVYHLISSEAFRSKNHQNWERLFRQATDPDLNQGPDVLIASLDENGHVKVGPFFEPGTAALSTPAPEEPSLQTEQEADEVLLSEAEQEACRYFTNEHGPWTNNLQAFKQHLTCVRTSDKLRPDEVMEVLNGIKKGLRIANDPRTGDFFLGKDRETYAFLRSNIMDLLEIFHEFEDKILPGDAECDEEDAFYAVTLHSHFGKVPSKEFISKWCDRVSELKDKQFLEEGESHILPGMLCALATFAAMDPSRFAEIEHAAQAVSGRLKILKINNISGHDQYQLWLASQMFESIRESTRHLKPEDYRDKLPLKENLSNTEERAIAIYQDRLQLQTDVDPPVYNTASPVRLTIVYNDTILRICPESSSRKKAFVLQDSFDPINGAYNPPVRTGMSILTTYLQQKRHTPYPTAYIPPAVLNALTGRSFVGNHRSSRSWELIAEMLSKEKPGAWCVTLQGEKTRVKIKPFFHDQLYLTDRARHALDYFTNFKTRLTENRIAPHFKYLFEKERYRFSIDQHLNALQSLKDEIDYINRQIQYAHYPQFKTQVSYLLSQFGTIENALHPRLADFNEAQLLQTVKLFAHFAKVPSATFMATWHKQAGPRFLNNTVHICDSLHALAVFATMQPERLNEIKTIAKDLSRSLNVSSIEKQEESLKQAFVQANALLQLGYSAPYTPPRALNSSEKKILEIAKNLLNLPDFTISHRPLTEMLRCGIQYNEIRIGLIPNQHTPRYILKDIDGTGTYEAPYYTGPHLLRMKVLQTQLSELKIRNTHMPVITLPHALLKRLMAAEPEESRLTNWHALLEKGSEQTTDLWRAFVDPDGNISLMPFDQGPEFQ